MTAPERYLSPTDMAAYLRERGVVISVGTVRAHLRDGRLPGVKVAGDWATPPAMLRAWEVAGDRFADPTFAAVLAAAENGTLTMPEPAKVIPFLVTRRKAVAS